MNDIHGLTVENLLRTLPGALQDDETMMALAGVAAGELAERPAEIDRIRIYADIDRLDERLLDILAYDFKVDWYGYDYSIEVKRELIKSSFYVHRHLGTKAAVTTALSGIYPGSTVQEWFEYDGEPYHFRIILDLSNQRIPLSLDAVVKAVDMYKSLRSHLEDDAIVFKSHFTIEIISGSAYVIYAVRLCGTYPVRATEGAVMDGGIVVCQSEAGMPYGAPRTGLLHTGAYPADSTKGLVSDGDVVVGTGADGAAYAAPRSGVRPETATQGGIAPDGISIVPVGGGTAYRVRTSGEYPSTAAQGGVDAAGIVLHLDEGGASYSAPRSEQRYTGTHPTECTVAGELPGAGIGFGVEGGSGTYDAKFCGDDF